MLKCDLKASPQCHALPDLQTAAWLAAAESVEVDSSWRLALCWQQARRRHSEPHS